MKILDFETYRRKLLLEAEGDAPEAPAEPAPAPEAPAEPAPASTPPPPPMPDSAPIDMGSTLPPDPNAPAAAPAGSGTIKLVIIDSDKKWHTKYSDGGGVKRYPEYEVTQAEIDKWITDSGLTDKAADINAAISGKKSLESDVLDKLKKSLNTKSFGKDRGEVDITFDANVHPSTSDLELIFVKSK